jgi:hypothetical protein
MSYLHHALVNQLEHLRPEHPAPAGHRLGIGHLAAAHAGKVPVHQISPHLAFQLLTAPVADVLEGQQPQGHFGRCAPSAESVFTIIGDELRYTNVNRGDGC